MKNISFLKQARFSAIVVAMTAFTQVQAVDMAAARGILAEVGVMAVQAKANLAAAASSGDINAISDAAKRADAVDAAMAEAQEAFTAAERSTAGGDEDAAAANVSDLEAARQKAEDALNGAVPEPTPMSAQQQWKESQKNTGGGPGRAFDPPNMEDVPWQSQGLRAFYQNLFGSFWNASGFGGGRGFGDRDATPE